MSLRFRKRLKVFPGIYLNLGMNGVSTTIGPRGANINIGKSGVYLNTGIPGTGLSNREKLFDVNDGNSGSSPDPNSFTNNEQNNIDSTNNITTSDGLIGLKEHLQEAKIERELSGREYAKAKNIYEELKANLYKKQNGLFSKIFTKQEVIEDLDKEVKETLKDLEELRIEHEESKADINIRFDLEIEAQYKNLSLSFIDLLKCDTIWDITTETVNTEIKSSAKTIIERKEVRFKLETIDFIRSEHSAFHLQNASGSDLFIYPAFLIIMNKQSEVDLIDLKDVSINFHLQRFLESKETIPSDSIIIDHTWYKVNKDGSRDLRYTGNYQIPVIEYGAFKISSSNGLNELYFISNVDLAIKFANSFQQYLDMLNNTGKKPMVNKVDKPILNRNDLSKQYYDLLVEFATQLSSLANKLGNDKTLEEKIKDSLQGTSQLTLMSYCVLYDMCQIYKIICNGYFKDDSLEMTGMALLSHKLIPEEDDVFNRGYEIIAQGHLKGIFKNFANNIVDIAHNNNPLKINIEVKEVNQIVSSKKIESNLSLPAYLKIIDHPLFEEYVTTLYRFATIIAKADNVVTKDEEEALKVVYQIIHNPLPEDKNTSLNISEVDSKESLDEVLKELETLIGLDSVKNEVKSLINYIKIQKEREKVGLKSSQVSYHCVFTGSPGTGKTTIARIVAKIYMHLGILKKGHLVETDRSGLVAEYTGQTAVKVNKTLNSAIDGVLFIDEAYSLVGENKDDFGKEAVATMIKRMEDDRDKLIVILAGYTQNMKTFIETNPGFKSRFNRYIEFIDYQPSELVSIFKQLCNKLDYKLTEDAEKKIVNVMTTAFSTRDKSFGNGRYVRNTFEKTLERQANRIAGMTSLTKDILTSITVDDIPVN